MPQQVLTDLERRTIVQLSIPRNVADLTHALRVDAFSPDRSEADVAEHLDELVGLGLVVKLAEEPDPSKLAVAAEKNSKTLDMGDEKAKLFAERVSAPSRAWRINGPTFMLSKEGMEWVRQPVANAPERADRDTVIRQITEAARAVVDPGLEGSIFDEDGGRMKKDVHLARGTRLDDATLVPTMLPEEFRRWAEQVRDEWEESTGEKLPPIPMMGGAGYSNETELLILDAENAKTTGYVEAAPWHMALSILAFTDADTGATADDVNHIPTYTGYARKSVAAADMNAAAAGSAANANAIVFANCTAGSSTIVAFAHTSAATLGRLVKYGTCASTTVSTTATPPQFAAGAYTTTLD